jgi:hypothetical protein
LMSTAAIDTNGRQNQHVPVMVAWLTELESAFQVEGGGGSRKSRVNDMVLNEA